MTKDQELAAMMVSDEIALVADDIARGFFPCGDHVVDLMERLLFRTGERLKLAGADPEVLFDDRIKSAILKFLIMSNLIAEDDLFGFYIPAPA